MNLQRFVIGGSLALAVSVASIAQDKRPVTFEDILAHKTVGSAVIAPNGESVLYTVTAWEEQDEGGKMASVSHVWRVSAGGGDAVQLTYGDKGERAPRWSPDGRYISFVAARGEGEDVKPQLWLMHTAGGEARELTETKEGVLEYAWSPDSATIAFVTKDGLSDDDAAKKKRRDDPDVYEGDLRFAPRVDDRRGHARSNPAHARYRLHRARPAELVARWRAPRVHGRADTLASRSPRRHLRARSLADDSVTKIAGERGSEGSPVWSPDGQSNRVHRDAERQRAATGWHARDRAR